MAQNQNGTAPDAKDDWRYYGGNPLALERTDTGGSYAGPFEGELQPEPYKIIKDRKCANSAPLGLSGFALTTFILSIINLNVRGLTKPNIVVGPSLAYGGLAQLLGGMFEMASGNTFAATALTSYGGFWISLGITFTPGGFGIAEAYGGMTPDFYSALSFYLFGWMIFTIFMWICTLRSTVAFNMLFFTVWLTFMCLGLAYYYNDGMTPAMPHPTLTKAGGGFGIVASFIAWWVMLSGLLDRHNSFFLVPVFPFPWSEEGRSSRRKQSNPTLDPEKQS